RALPFVIALEAGMAWYGLGQRMSTTFAITAGTAVECLVAWWGFTRPSFRRASERGPDLAPRLALIALVVGAAGATTAWSIERLWSPQPIILDRAWLMWTLSDAGTLICFLPLALVVLGLTDGRSYAPPRARVEAVALFLVTVAVGWSHVIAETVLQGLVLPGLMLGIVPVAWAATRFGLTYTVWVMALLTFATFTGMKLHPGDLFGGRDALTRQFVLEGNLVVLTLVGLFGAQVIEAERRARAHLTRMSEELRVQVEHVRLSQRSGRTGSWDCALDGSGMVWSEELYVLLRLDRASFPPSFENLERAMTPAARETTVAALQAVRDGARYSVHTAQFDWADGSRTWHAVRWEVMDTPQGARLVATHTDITDQIERRQAAEHMAALVGSSGEAILAVDEEARVRNWNAAAERLFGWTSAEAVGRTFLDLVQVTEQASQRARIASAFRDGRAGAEVLKMRSCSGRILHVNTSMLPVRDATGRITEIAVLCMDLTRQHELENQLLQAQKMEIMGRLTGSIAHDFNNLLTAILGFSTLARERVKQDAVAHGEIAQVVQAAERATALTQRLLSFSRPSQGRAERFALDPALQQLEPLLRRLLGEGTELVLDLHSAGAWVKLDPTQFEQVLLNLVVNARDAMPFGGHIRVETRRMPEGVLRQAGPAMGSAGPGVTIRVMDTGEGMDDATRERIFEPFFTTKDSGRGTGLGLSTVLAIVQEGGGAISVQSTPGEGTCFAVQLPEVDPGMIAHLEPPAPRAPDGHGERILVVEDEPLVRELMLAALGPAGYRVEAVGSAELALERILADEVGYALVVSDVMLPRMTGIELARQLHKRRPTLPLLLLSGHGEAVREARLTVPFLTKPFGNDELLDMIARLIGVRGPAPTPTDASRVSPAASSAPDSPHEVARSEP
ncbi:MAG: hypothetical protein RL760_639, partial [Candidatus Eisenbacteria bacterium]